MYYLIMGLLNVAFIVCFVLYHKRRTRQFLKREQQRLADEYVEQRREHLERLAQKDVQALTNKEKEIEQAIVSKISHLNLLNNQMAKLNQDIEDQRTRALTYEQNLRATAEQSVESYEQKMRSAAEQKIKIEQEEKLKAATAAHAETMAALGAEAAAATEQLEQLTKQLDEYKAQQAAIAAALLRQRELEEQQDFFRICLTEDSLSDISFLKEARRNLKKPEIVDKIIYDNYIAKPVLEMIKRVLSNESFSGIYKITCIKTGEIYIGKSTDIKSRWQQHAKTAFNCGTIAHSLLHTKMKQYGIENFTFELVEKVPKDQLSEREKFYIEFYQSKETGLNERKG